MSLRIGIIGMGKMGSRMACALSRNGFEVLGTGRGTMYACDADGNKVMRSGDETANLGLATASDVIIIATKQKDLSALSAELSGKLDGKLVISIVAGVDTENLETRFTGAKVARAMTNIAAGRGMGMSGFCMGSGCDGHWRADAVAVLSALGRVVEVEEKHMDDFTAISGCGLGFISHFLGLIHRTAVEDFGMDERTARDIVAQTAAGVVSMAESMGLSEITDAVRTRGGMTDAGLKALEDAGFDKAVRDAVISARDHGRELNALAKGSKYGLRRS